jgi:hypothetical protein
MLIFVSLEPPRKINNVLYYRDSSTRFFVFLHELTPYGLLIHTLKYFLNSVSNLRRYSYSKVKIRDSALSDTALIPNQCCRSQR